MSELSAEHQAIEGKKPRIRGADGGRTTEVPEPEQSKEQNPDPQEVQRQLEERIRQQTAELRAILATTPIGLAIAADVDGRHIRGNPAIERILGLSPGAELPLGATYGGGFRFSRGGVDLSAEDLPMQRACRGETVTGQTLEVTRGDGRTVSLLVNAAPLYDAQGRPRGAVGAFVDISEHRRAEETLRRSDRVYRAIGESIDHGVWICEPDGRNSYASPSFLRLVGLTQEQCSNFGWGEVLHPEDAERTIAAWKECVRTGGVWDIEHRFRGVDEQWHPILARGVPVRDEEGRIVCWAGINLDISKLKQAEAELRNHALELKAANEELARFNKAMVGRELRMIELKKEVNALCAQLGQPGRYKEEPDQLPRGTG